MSDETDIGLRQVPRERLLYDVETLRAARDAYGNEYDIKRNVKTSAVSYEIRTALRFWFGGQQSYRTSERIWRTCERVDEGEARFDRERDEVVETR